MEIEFQNTEKDYIDFNKILIKQRFQRFQITIVLLLVSILIFFSDDLKHSNFQNCLITIAIYLVVVSVYFYFLPLWSANRKLSKSLIENSFSVEKRKFTITDEGLRTEGTGYDLLRNWDSIKTARRKGKFVQIVTAGDGSVILSEKWFSSEVELSNFLGLIQSKITYQPQAKIINPKYSSASFGAKKPPYLLGLLCIIPLIGAFVGAGLLLYGIFVYKDKWIIIIGAAGILFTVGLYSSLDYSSTHNDTFKKLWIETDKDELNGLVKQIEFYKIQSGHYPDSLKQMDLKGENINIFDPLLISSGDKNGIYNYHRIGKKYTLFSSGIDKIPNTADDIYPSLQIDTSKIGLIINRR
jgi:hypothetical protein